MHRGECVAISAGWSLPLLVLLLVLLELVLLLGVALRCQSYRPMAPIHSSFTFSVSANM